MMGSPTEEWYDSLSPGIMFWKTSTQELLNTEPINNKMKKDNGSIIHVGDTILSAAAKTIINENWCLLDNQST